MRCFAMLMVFVIAFHATRAHGQDSHRDEAERLFAVKVLPLLKTKCFACHGDEPKKLRGDLDLTSRASMLRGGDNGPALIEKQPDKSPLFTAVMRENPDMKMPPKDSERLTTDEIAAMRRWIEAGAPWPTPAKIQQLAKAADWDVKGGVAVKTSGGLSAEWTNRKYDPENLWAYQPLARAERPDDPKLPPVDALIGARLKTLGLAPAPLADRRTLIRRATFDLTGLPPTPREVDAFVNDPDDDVKAFGKVVDRLLASPHYGERWAQHWLDVVRYADSHGYANDFDRGNAWRYRDYVVRSFNQDKPYDQFVREQIAGDEIDPNNPEMLIAVGVLRMGPWELTAMEVPKVARQKYLDDVTDVVGQAFLAHPMQCARCHDHKFDPVPTRDYYRMQAAFASTQIAERSAAFLKTENLDGFEERKVLEERRGRLQQMLRDLDVKEQAAARAWCKERGLPYVARKKGLKDGVPESKLPPAKIGWDLRDLGIDRFARKGLDRLKWELDRYEPIALSVYSGRTPMLKAIVSPFRMPANRLAIGEVEQTCILAGGDPFSPKDPVTPGVLSAIPGPWDLPTDLEGRRLALARWMTGPDNPLTARVIVNRIWQGHFGQGLVATPNNFGATGKKPTHPELLDHLARRFIADGWSIKALHRHIMLSKAYRRSTQHPDVKAMAAKDPQGTSYAVFRPRRLTAEELRDAMLAVSGELNPAVGGIPIRPEINPEVALQTRQVMGAIAAAWQPNPRPEQRHRRSLYVLRLQGLRDPFFEVFNQPGPELPCERRDASIVTPQAFSLFNSESTRARALALAARLLKEESSKDRAIDAAFLSAFGRRPSDAERQGCLKHWDAMTARHANLALKKPAVIREVIRVAVEENSGEKYELKEFLDFAPQFVPDLHPADVSPEVRGLMEVCLVLLNANEFVYLD